MRTKRPSPRQRGFSLLELLLVCAIIGIIMAIAIPKVFTSIRASREARAQANVRAIGAGQISYYATNGRFGVFSTLFAGKYLGNQFTDNGDGSLNDSTFDYKLAFTLNADGISLDADPRGSYADSYRWFRYRLGRLTTGPGFEGVIYQAPSGVYSPSPPTAAYTVLGGG